MFKKQYRQTSSELKQASKKGNLQEMSSIYQKQSEIRFDEKGYSDCLWLSCYSFYLYLFWFKSLSEFQTVRTSKLHYSKPFLTPKVSSLPTIIKLKDFFSNDEIISAIDRGGKESLIPGHPISEQNFKRILEYCLDGDYDNANRLISELFNIFYNG